MEQNNHGEHKMCDWCGNKYGHKYTWMRLVVGILIGLFIFSAGYHLGELNVLVQQSAVKSHYSSMRMNRMMMDGTKKYGTTIVVPVSETKPAAQAPAQQ